MSNSIPIVRETVGRVRVITLARPEINNGMSGPLAAALLDAYLEADADDAIGAIVTRAQGKAFCVGADFGDLEAFDRMGIVGITRENFRDIRTRAIAEGHGQRFDDLGVNEFAWRVLHIDKPMIASLQGAAAGSGMAFAMLHHFRIASTSTRLATAMGALGLAMEFGMSVTMPLLAGHERAMELFLTGRKLEAEEARALGLLTRVVAPEQLESETMAFATQLANTAPLGTRAAIEELMAPVRKDLYERLALEWRNLCRLFETADRKEGVAALIARRTPKFEGH